MLQTKTGRSGRCGWIAHTLRCLALLAAVLCLASPTHAKTLKALDDDGKLSGPFGALELHISMFSDIAEKSMLAGTFGYSGRGGYRWSNWGVFLIVEQNMWLALEYEKNVVQGVVNIGVGGEFLFADGRMRTALALGPSILAYDTLLDDAGSVGIYLDVRPLGVRWTVHKYLVLGLDPLSFALVAPVLDSIPLVYIQYRTSLYLEAAF